MYKKDTSLCFTGHRNEKLPQTVEEMEKLNLRLFEEVHKAIEEGINTFYFGGCRGFDLLCAEVVEKIKRQRVYSKSIYLICVVPFENQAKNWKEVDRDKYYNIMPLCDEVIMLNTSYKKGCYYERNRYMVEHSSKVICYYDGTLSGTAYTINYAKKNKLKIVNTYDK
ncbi:MAG: SLOG family protein [Anaerotignaceae bacterium]